jgi:hypothetical protein
MSELSLTQTPNGGWIFFSPQTNWSMPNPVSVTFDQACILILKHRQANPAIAASHNLSTDKASIAAELIKFTRARLGIPEGSVDPPKPGAAPQKAGACCGG